MELTNRDELDALHGKLPKKILAICSPPRTGSYLLCRQLTNGGIAIPHEYFNDIHIKKISQRWNIGDSPTLYIDTLLRKRTNENGIFSVKLQWEQFRKWRNLIEKHIFHGREVVYIFLTRMNIKAQAISLHKSLVSGIWGITDEITTRPLTNIRLGDIDNIRHCARIIYREELMWRCYFAEHAINPMRIYYEDYVRDQPGHFKLIAERLGITASPPPAEEKSPPNTLARLQVDVEEFCKILHEDLKKQKCKKKMLERVIKNLSKLLTDK